MSSSSVVLLKRTETEPASGAAARLGVKRTTLIGKIRKSGLSREMGYGLFSMQTRHIFLIESDSSGHRLTVDRNRTGTFATLGAAEAKAAYIARLLLPAATLKFELDFKWTLSDWEIRAATLELPPTEDMENSYVDR